MESRIKIPQKTLKIGLLYDPTIILLDIYPKEIKILIPKHTCAPMILAVLFTRPEM